MESAKELLVTIKDKTVNAFDYVTETIKNTGSSIGSSSSSTVMSGVDSFKGTSLGDTFFKNIQAIFITVVILIGGIMYIDFAKENINAPGPDMVRKTVTIEPNTSRSGSGTGTGGSSGTGGRYIPRDEPWTEPILAMQRELTEGFGSAYSEKELENIHTKCSDDFCVLHNKSPKDLEEACNTISDQNICATKCCCGWAKHIGYNAENDMTTKINSATAKVSENNDKKPGKCVAGNSKTPLNNYDIHNNVRDMEYYYYMGKCVGGTACTSTVK
jgi:hypothetical protein